MMVFLKVTNLFLLLTIGYQDIREREVAWLLYPLLFIIGGTTLFLRVQYILFLQSIILNMALMLMILMILYIYTRLILKRKFLNEVFGLGDVLFFIAISSLLPSINFIITFCCSLIFSLFIWIIYKNKSKFDTVPLAGYMAIFYGILIIVDWYSIRLNLYLK